MGLDSQPPVMPAGQSTMDVHSNEAGRIARQVTGDRRLPFLVCAAPRRGGWSQDMDYLKPADVVTSMIDTGTKKLALGPRDLLTRGALSGALLGAATTLAFTGAVTTGQPLVGALIFPVGLVMIVLLGLELVTGVRFHGSCALRDLQAGQRDSLHGTCRRPGRGMT
jgi:hypothetical protein